MPGKNLYLSVDDFNDQGTFDPSGLECTMNNLVFRKGDTVENFRIKEILDACKKYNGFNINTLIIKSKNHLTIWIEEKNKPISDASVASQENPPVVSQSDNNKLPTKTVTKKYRGRVYEETVIDWSAVQQLKQNKPRRKYRGQYID